MKENPREESGLDYPTKLKPRPGKTVAPDCLMQPEMASDSDVPRPVPVAVLDRAALRQVFLNARKPQSQWQTGAEFELFGYHRQTLERLTPTEVQTVLTGFDCNETVLVTEDKCPTELRAEWGRITLEPGGQIEYSGRSYRSLVAMERDLRWYLAYLHEIAEAHGFIFLATGFDPLRTMAEQHWIAKPRYKVMKPYLAAQGQRGWDMMTRTCAVQTNLDYDSELDLAKKFIVANRLAPIVAAIFANSPFEAGRLAGFKSTRYAVWLDTDPDRTGLSPVAAGNFSLDQFLDYALAVPMFFVRRQGQYIDLTGYSFAQYLSGTVSPERPTLQDFLDHLSTIFTDARLRPYIEVRSADSGSLALLLALQALWKGLLYDRVTLDEALRLAPPLTLASFAALQLEVARQGLAAREQVDVLALAQETVRLAQQGLSAIAPAERGYLDILEQQVIREAVCPADILLRDWRGDINAALNSLRVA